MNELYDRSISLFEYKSAFRAYSFTDSHNNVGIFEEFMKTLPPVTNFLERLQKEFPDAKIKYKVDISHENKKILFIIVYDYLAIDDIPIAKWMIYMHTDSYFCFHTYKSVNLSIPCVSINRLIRSGAINVIINSS